MAKPRAYKDDLLILRTFRISLKYELIYINALIQLLRSDKREKIIDCIEGLK